MRIYDCFIFNDELDLLELRFSHLYDQVDFFVLVESSRTLSGHDKALTFHINKERFNPFLDKVIYMEAPKESGLSAWDYEFFQRNYIKEGLKECNPEDIIFISDVDEILNISKILSYKNLKFPSVIELPVCYYYLNLVSEDIFRYNLVAKYSTIKRWHIGMRNYLDHTENLVSLRDVNTGWHFSYLFGDDTDKYINKIKSFSHQEYNTPYYLDKERLLSCIHYGKDIFERNYKYYFRNRTFIKDIDPLLKRHNMQKYYKKPTLGQLARRWFRDVKIELHYLKKALTK